MAIVCPFCAVPLERLGGADGWWYSPVCGAAFPDRELGAVELDGPPPRTSKE